MTVLEIFAGAGGASLGLRSAGWQHVAHVEWDADACATLRAAGFKRVVEADVRDLYHRSWPGADLLWASFPCQAFSTAGKRKGAQDERNGWPWTRDAIDAVGPAWFIGENVPGLLQHRGDCERYQPDTCAGCYGQSILAELATRFAWAAVWTLDAADFGVPQRRRRVFFVGGPHRVSPPQRTHCDPRMGLLLAGGCKPWVTVREALNLDGVLRPVRGAGMVERHGLRPGHSTDEPSPTVLGGEKMSGPRWVLEGGGGQGHLPQSQRTPDPDQPSTTLWGYGNRETPKLLDRPSPAVCTTEGKGSVGDARRLRKLAKASDLLACATGRRRLTVAECAVLQGFPVSCADFGRCRRGGCRMFVECRYPLHGYPLQGSKTSRYRQVGNAVPPALAEAVGCAVLAAARLEAA